MPPYICEFKRILSANQENIQHNINIERKSLSIFRTDNYVYPHFHAIYNFLEFIVTIIFQSDIQHTVGSLGHMYKSYF